MGVFLFENCYHHHYLATVTLKYLLRVCSQANIRDLRCYEEKKSVLRIVSSGEVERFICLEL